MLISTDRINSRNPFDLAEKDAEIFFKYSDLNLIEKLSNIACNEKQRALAFIE